MGFRLLVARLHCRCKRYESCDNLQPVESEGSHLPTATRFTGLVRNYCLVLIAFVLFSTEALAATGPSKSIKEPNRPSSPTSMQIYQSKYYIVHSDLPTDDVKEAIIRMTRMAEEYHTRTQGFSGDIRERMPFYLFKTAEEYYKAGGLPGSAGVFDPNTNSLMAIAGEDTSGQTWHVVQHEGFHQFAHFVIRGELPAWVNEGIAEYFGESIFTGDGFVSGVIPPWRLKRIQAELKVGRLKSVKDMMLTSYAEWNGQLAIENYDQAWSMVHFLAQGENGRYQEAFVTFMKLIGKGTPWPNAWKQTFGDAVGFETRWKDYWTNMPANPTSNLYVQAATAVFTSFLGRSAAQREPYTSFDEFLAAAQGGKIKTGETIEDWLPPKLLRDASEAAKDAPVKWTIEPTPAKTSELLAVLTDGTRMVGTYAISGSHTTRVMVEVDDTGSALKDAQSLLQEGKKDQARAILQRALKAHPKSPLAEEARKLIVQTK